MKFCDVIDELYKTERIDERKSVVTANAKNLPGGGFGLCLLCINKNYLDVYATNNSVVIGSRVYHIDITKIENPKHSAFIFNTYLKFTYYGREYKFADFGKAKEFLVVFDEEISKKSST